MRTPDFELPTGAFFIEGTTSFWIDPSDLSINYRWYDGESIRDRSDGVFIEKQDAIRLIAMLRAAYNL